MNCKMIDITGCATPGMERETIVRLIMKERSFSIPQIKFMAICRKMLIAMLPGIIAICA